MPRQAEFSPFLKELFPHAGPELSRLLQGAADNAFLLRSDFQTIRDLTEIAGCPRDEAPTALLLALVIALDEGSLCIEAIPALLAERLQDLVPVEEATAWGERIARALDEPGFPELIGTAPTDHRPIILHLSAGRRFLYFQRYLRAELDFRGELASRLDQPPAPGRMPTADCVQAVLADMPFPLDPEQQRALRLALSRDFAIISGGPGTGKTSIVLAVLRCLVRAGVAPQRIALAAPTGRAARRLSDSLRAGLDRVPSSRLPDSPDLPLRELSARTLHNLLEYRPHRHLFARHRENPIDADVVIVDEVSMVGVVMMSQLMQALAPGAKLILLGDKDQLPSVDAGAVLASLVPDSEPTGSAARDFCVLLQTNHRSQQDIQTAAAAINARDASIVDRLSPLAFPADNALDAYWRMLEQQGGCRLLEQTHASAGELRGFLQHWAQQAYFGSQLDGSTLAEMIHGVRLNRDAEANFGSLFNLLDRFRLLTMVRDGAWGCDEINEYLANFLRTRLDAGSTSSLFAGAPVLVTRNDPAAGVFNGDVGIAVRGVGGGLSVLFQRPTGSIALPVDALPAHELGFALTVHKSQGSEYAHVMVVLPPSGGRRLLTKELLYTAITRAKSLAVLCGTREVIKHAVSRGLKRESGFS